MALPEKILLCPFFPKGGRLQRWEIERKNLEAAIRKNPLFGSTLWKRGARGDFARLFEGLMIFFTSSLFQKGMVYDEFISPL